VAAAVALRAAGVPRPGEEASRGRAEQDAVRQAVLPPEEAQRAGKAVCRAGVLPAAGGLTGAALQAQAALLRRAAVRTVVAAAAGVRQQEAAPRAERVLPQECPRADPAVAPEEEVWKPGAAGERAAEEEGARTV
jgi:hypothetical protein